MSYPQPIASQEIAEGQEFYRLKTRLDSSGDAYELNVSAKAFAIGPESDVARCRVTYYDPIHGAQSIIVGVGAPFVGRVDSNPQAVYPNGVPGNIIITPEDIIPDRAALITAFTGVDTDFDIIGFAQPKLDFVAYLSEPGQIPLRRADFVQRGALSIHNHLADDYAGSGTTYLFVPFYRRKYASFKLRNNMGATYAVEIRGIGLLNSGISSGGGTTRVQRSTLIGPTNVLEANTLAAEVRVSAYGAWDYLGIAISGNGYDAANNASKTAITYTLEVFDEEE